MFATWHDLYASDLQSPWALLVVPVLFLVWFARGGRPGGAAALPAAAPFVAGYAVFFALETILDPLATGPLSRALGLAGGAGGTAVMVFFVLLGDFRVYLLLFGLLAIAAQRDWRSALPTAAAWTLLVPLIAYPLHLALHAARPSADPNSIWLIYEVLFAAVALALRVRLLPARLPEGTALRAFLGAALLYVAVYYALWASADVLIQIAGLDVGWLLRVVPNQLYYSFWVPFVVFRFFARR
jgi:hypothetical protein